jgi:predicted nucleic acid-binding protein
VGRARGAPGGPGPARTLLCDTNVLIRLLTGDPPEQARAAVAAFEAAAEGRFALVLTDVVLAEACYVLASAGVAPAQAAGHLLRILDLPGVEVVDETVLRGTLELWSEGKLDVADAYLAALARRIRGGAVLSFDRDLERVPGVTRVDPAAVAPPT